METTTINGYDVEAFNRKAQVSIKNKDPFVRRVYSLKRARDKDDKPIYTEKEIADLMGMSVVDMRKELSRRLHEERKELVKEAAEYKKAGKSINEIAVKMGLNESTVRLLLDIES